MSILPESPPNTLDLRKLGSPKAPKKRITFATLAALIALLLAAGSLAGGIYLLHKSRDANPFPKTVSQSVDFPLYFPDEQKLPGGFTSHASLAKTIDKNVVSYKIEYPDHKKKFVITLQKKPSDDELGFFSKEYIPINRKVLTLVGTATMGAVDKQTVVSLPTTSSTWIIITGPADAYNSAPLLQVLKSFSEAK